MPRGELVVLALPLRLRRRAVLFHRLHLHDAQCHVLGTRCDRMILSDACRLRTARLVGRQVDGEELAVG